MFNPFKKKEEDGFQMNDMELPSLGENSFPNSNTDTQMPELPSLDSNNLGQSNSTNEMNSMEQSNPMDMPNMNTPDQSLENTPGIGSINDMNSTPSFDSSNNNNNQNQNSPFGNENFGTQSSSGNDLNNNNNQNQDLHNEISKAKLDTLSSKMEVLEHKVSSIDNKLDLILQLIQAEVSTETKMKVNMDSKMQQFR